ncbi:DUF1828 domain-containing protein [Conexibacter stalactiti]|uniref:DUF1828 domain-containing protein n=1 Tax=Conexibacter stalactiti TaxID=1940611 RepID=A0ABU4HRB3_9ACTN|nr:DUF1828 domain-containing protein [Conexibacter stalactiti]MDW5595840.1 DUF1828 domain-containing protein [Conexibacter stalactiti]MEC5036482.1 DUF1828 domain-containing protein [Conexibacter stalactiti]
MTIADLRPLLTAALSAGVVVHPVSQHEAQVVVPFDFPDGDGFVIFVRDRDGGTVEITDHAHTLMHLGYHTDVDRLQSGARAETFERIRCRHGIEDRDGELVTVVPWRDLPTAFFAFVQGLIEISELRNLDQERVRSTFRDDVRRVLVEAFADEIETDWVDRERDDDGLYPIPYVLNGTERPIAIFDVATEENAASALVVAKQHLAWERRLHLVAIERDQTRLPRRHVAWLSDAFDKQFATLSSREQAIVGYLREQHALFKRLADAE